MAQFVKHFVQDLQQDIKIRQCGTLVFNADDLSNVVSVELYDGGLPYTPAGTVVGAVICPDGSTVPIDNGSISGNTVSITLTAACFAIPGQIGVGIQLVTGSTKTTVLKAIYNAERFETDDVIDPDSRITLSVSDLVDDIAAAVATIPADYSDLLAAIAPTFSSANTYRAGQFVWYDGALYRFTADHTGNWNADDVTAATVAGGIEDADDALDELDTRVNTLNGLVNYGYETPYTGTVAKGSSTSAYKVTFDRNGTLLRLNGYGGDLTLGVSANSLKVQLNNVNAPVTAITLGNVLSTAITLIDGHTYRLRQRIISAGANNTAVIKPYYHKGGASGVTLIGTAKQDANGDWYTDLEYSATTYPNGVHLLANIPRADNTVVLDNVLLEYTLEDLTVSQLAALEARVDVLEAKLDYLELSAQIDLSGM